MTVAPQFLSNLHSLHPQSKDKMALDEVQGRKLTWGQRVPRGPRCHCPGIRPGEAEDGSPALRGWGKVTARPPTQQKTLRKC